MDDKAIIEFLRRSYFAVDGLWFVRIEEEHSYDEAMRLDEQVWDVLPKIQARKARELLDIEGGSLGDLLRGLSLKFASEGHLYRVAERTPNVLRVLVGACPWLEILKKAGKVQKAAEICDRICAKDFAVWARQFSEDVEFSLEEKLPEGAPACELLFARALAAGTMPDPSAEKEAAG